MGWWIFLIAQTALLVLKLGGVVAWSWWLIFLPAMIYGGLAVIALLFILVGFLAAGIGMAGFFAELLER